MACWKARKEYTVCWNTFTTGIPRTYSVPALLIVSWAAWYSAMSAAFFPPIMVPSAPTDITAARRQAAPIRQSNTNISTSMARNMAMVPTISARLWASRVSVSEAAPSRRLRKRPDALLSKNPSGAFIRCAMPCLRILDAVRNAARCVHISAAK